ncbi:MAG: hypothetical protein SFX73_03415 [Kofleriaceae bacterium]|nr:hypothetical protein [Kofleriaceae bacterium]
MSSKRGWITGGAMAAAALGADARQAHACHEDPDVPGYEKSWSVGLMFGVAFGAETRFVYGLDLRRSEGQFAAIARIEARDITSVRLTIAGHGVSNSGLSSELGVALHSRRKHTDIDFAAGLHIAGGLYDGGGGLHIAGMLPLYGDTRNYDISATAALVPNEVKLCFGGGRRLRDGDASVLPTAAVFAESATDADIARAYVRDARTEYASIYAFERMAAELAAVGAPDALVRAARQAADEEARHTRLCAELAGIPFSLLPLADHHASPRWTRPSTAALVTLAREAWLDGCLGEGIAARQAHDAAARASALYRDAQHTIADDEQRHAELAWAVLEWAWRQRDPRVRDAIADAVQCDPELPESAPIGGDPDRLAARGRLSPERAHTATQRAAGEAVDRARRLVA